MLRFLRIINKPVLDLSRVFLKQGIKLGDKLDGDELYLKVAKTWFEQLASWSLDIQSITLSRANAKGNPNLFSIFSGFQKTPIEGWSQFDLVKTGQSLYDVKTAVRVGMLSTLQFDKGGMKL
jgi:hypothetical protein